MSEELEPLDGPPPKFSDREWPRPWMGEFLDSLALSPVVAVAARAAGINRQYSYEAAEIWPAFAEGWKEAREVGIELLEQNTYRWATLGMETREITRRKDGDGKVIEETEKTSRHLSPTLAIFMLKRFRPEYRDSYSVEHHGPDGGPVRLEVDRMPTRERMLELAALAQQLALPAGIAPVVDGSANGSSGGE